MRGSHSVLWSLHLLSLHGELKRAAQLDVATGARTRVLADLGKSHRGGGSIPARHECTVKGSCTCIQALPTPTTPSENSLLERRMQPLLSLKDLSYAATTLSERSLLLLTCCLMSTASSCCPTGRLLR